MIRAARSQPSPFDELPAVKRESLLAEELDWVPAGTPAVYLLDKCQYVIQPGGACDRRYRYLVRILTDAGVKAFMTMRVSGSVEVARTIKADGRQIMADIKDGDAAFADLEPDDLIEFQGLSSNLPTTGLAHEYSAWLDFSTIQAWDQVVRWYQDVISGRLAPSAELRELAEQLDVSQGPDSLRIRRATHWVMENIQYEGEQFVNSGFLPRSIREILRTGYGDCKDQAVLLVGLLRTLGVSASVALVNTSDHMVRSYLPSQRFTHAIVKAVARDGRVYWIDTTARRLTFPDVPYTLEGQEALVVDEEGSGFERIPLDPLPDFANRADLHVVVAADGGINESIELELPAGATLLGEVKSVKLDCPAASYRLWSEPAPTGRVRVARHFEIRALRIQPEDYAAFREMIHAAWKAENERLVLQMP